MSSIGTISYREPNGTMDNTATLGDELNYDPSTGVFEWKILWRWRRKKGKVGAVHKDGYRRIYVCGKLYKAEQLAWVLYYKRWPNSLLDHINGIRDDNRIANLREANYSQNAANRRGYARSGFKGVTRVRNKFVAQITHQRRCKYLGTFNTPEQAHARYKQEAEKIFGPFVRTDTQ